MKILVVHQGKRDDYQVSIALSNAGHEVTLVTSGYPSKNIKVLGGLFPKWNALKKFGNRYNKELDSIDVSSGLVVEILGKTVERFVGEAVGQSLVDWDISRRAQIELGKVRFDAVICYNYNAFDIISADSLQNVPKILFQCHPHPVLLRETFLKYSREGLFPLQNREREFSYSKNYLAKLISECYFANYIICASHFSKNSLVHVGVDGADICVIPYGRSTVFSSSILNSRASTDSLKLIFVGQFVHRKGILILWKILNSLNFPVKIVFVGRGIYEVEPLSGLNNPNVEASVLWDISQAELIAAYSAADVFLFPSLIEGFAHVILEAMSMGCVPVVSDAGCGPDIIDHGINGFYASANNVEYFSKILTDLYQNDQLSELKKNARAKAQEYSWDRFQGDVANFVELAVSRFKSLDQNR